MDQRFGGFQPEYSCTRDFDAGLWARVCGGVAVFRDTGLAPADRHDERPSPVHAHRLWLSDTPALVYGRFSSNVGVARSGAGPAVGSDRRRIGITRGQSPSLRRRVLCCESFGHPPARTDLLWSTASGHAIEHGYFLSAQELDRVDGRGGGAYV